MFRNNTPVRLLGIAFLATVATPIHAPADELVPEGNLESGPARIDGRLGQDRKFDAAASSVVSCRKRGSSSRSARERRFISLPGAVACERKSLWRKGFNMRWPWCRRADWPERRRGTVR